MLVVSCISINRHPSNSQTGHHPSAKKVSSEIQSLFGCFDFRMITSNPAEPPKTRSNSEQPRKEPKQTVKKHKPKPGRRPRAPPPPSTRFQNSKPFEPTEPRKKKKKEKHPQGQPRHFAPTTPLRHTQTAAVSHASSPHWPAPAAPGFIAGRARVVVVLPAQGKRKQQKSHTHSLCYYYSSTAPLCSALRSHSLRILSLSSPIRAGSGAALARSPDCEGGGFLSWIGIAFLMGGFCWLRFFFFWLFSDRELVLCSCCVQGFVVELLGELWVLVGPISSLEQEGFQDRCGSVWLLGIVVIEIRLLAVWRGWAN